MKQLGENCIIFIKGRKKWWELIFPFFCFVIALAIFYNAYEVLTTTSNPDFVEVILGWSFAALLFIVLGSVFGMVKDHYFDFEKQRYKIVKRVGIIGFGGWHGFNSLEYVSVFKNPNSDYEVNLWFNTNKYFTIHILNDKEEAIEAGRTLAKKLEISFHHGLNEQEFYVEEEAIVIPEDQRKIDAHFSQGRRPFWQTIIAASCYTAAIVILYLFYISSSIDLEGKKIILPIRMLELPFILITLGIGFSVVNDYLFDFQNKQFRIIHNIGPIRWGKWRRINSLDYISVFQKVEGKFEINLWYNKNRHINFYVFRSYNEAMSVGELLAKKLRINLVDASSPRDSKWIEL